MTRQLIGAAIAVLALAKTPDVDGVLAAFWNAQNPREAARAAEQVVSARVPFDDAYRRLKQGSVRFLEAGQSDREWKDGVRQESREGRADPDEVGGSR